MKKELLVPGCIYHLFNRGNNRENIFREEINYPFFLGLVEKYLAPIAHVYAYCLLKNHFHLLVHLYPESELSDKLIEKPHLPFSNLFNAYAKSYNKVYKRTGSLFEEHPERRRIDDERYFLGAVKYIHTNPVNHGFVYDIDDYPWSSYPFYKQQTPSFINKTYVLAAFGGLENFIFDHKT
jgi:REP element-mobilizing transposase RayT